MWNTEIYIGDSLNTFWMVLSLKLKYHIGFLWSVVDGNPHLMLINQVEEAQRAGNLEAPILTSKNSSSSGGLRILPPVNPAGKINWSYA